MKFKSLLSYVSYFIIALVVSYLMQWITVLFVWSMRFTAADSYPGDLSRSHIIILSIVFPMIHFIILSIYLIIHSSLMSLLKIPFQGRIPIMLNVVITLCLIGYFLKVF